MKQINPPFDGSEPCPMCPTEIRSVSALVHNMLVRWPSESGWLVKLYDLSNTNLAIHSAHPAIVDLLEQARKIVAAYRENCVMEGNRILCKDSAPIAACIPELRRAAIAAEPLSDAHFHDSRHASGGDNILRAPQGGRSSLDGSYCDYNHTVDVVSAGADITHRACGTGLRLHDVFKTELVKDPTFYGKVWCPKCGINAPTDQFEVTLQVSR